MLKSVWVMLLSRRGPSRPGGFLVKPSANDSASTRRSAVADATTREVEISN